MLIKYYLIGIFFVTCFSIWLYSRRKFYYMHWKINGPICLPLIGLGLNFMKRENVFPFIDKVIKKYGNIAFGFVALLPYLFVNDPILIEEIYNSDQMKEKMEATNLIKIFLGDGLFTSTGEKWIKHRKIVNKSVRHKSLISLFPTFNKQGKIVTDKIMRKYIGKGECYLRDEFEKCTIYTSMINATGEDLDFEDENLQEFVSLVRSTQRMLSQRATNPIYNFFYPILPISKKYAQMVKKVQNNVNEAIKKRFNYLEKLENPGENNNLIENENENNEKKPMIFLDQVYEFYKKDELSLEDLQAESLTLIFAAFETTANTLYTTLLLLAMYPKYQDILYKEIMSVCPDDDIDLTYEHIRNMPYSEMVLNETMRLIATVPLVGRKAGADFTSKNGLFIAKGTNVLISIFHLHRDKKIWGPNARKFNPDNFLKDNISKKHPYSFIPFTKGARICLGWRYAMLSLQILLSHIIKKYEIKTKWKFDDLECLPDVTINFVKKPTIEFSSRNNI